MLDFNDDTIKARLDEFSGATFERTRESDDIIERKKQFDAAWAVFIKREMTQRYIKFRYTPVNSSEWNYLAQLADIYAKDISGY